MRPTELGEGGWRYHVDGELPVHVWPEGDLIAHDVDDERGEECVCLPRPIPVSRGDGSVGWLAKHSALDGRA